MKESVLRQLHQCPTCLEYFYKHPKEVSEDKTCDSCSTIDSDAEVRKMLEWFDKWDDAQDFK